MSQGLKLMSNITYHMSEFHVNTCKFEIKCKGYDLLKGGKKNVSIIKYCENMKIVKKVTN